MRLASHLLRLGFLATLGLSVALPASAQDIQLVPGSTIPRVQLTGEHFQIQSDGVYLVTPTQSTTMSRFGVVGTDLGRAVTVGDRILLFFGDTGGAYKQGDRYYGSRGIPAGVSDSIGYLPNVDFSQCRYIPDVVEQMAKGVASPVVDSSACPSLSFFLNLLRAVDEHRFKPLVISGLDADEDLGLFRVPTSVIYHNDRIYVFATTKHQDSRPAGAFWFQSVAAKSDQSPTLWSDTNPPAFTKLYTVSTHAAVEDPANPPAIENDGGKFMGVQAVAMTAGSIADLRLTRFLPRELQTTDVVFLWGLGWNALKSDLYLAAFALSDIEAGPSKWFYYAGSNRWSASEQEAVGLLGTNDVSQQSIKWNAALGRFVMMRGGTGRQVAQFATAPWGPWSTPITLLAPGDEWINKIVHRPGADQIVDRTVPIYNRDGTLSTREEERGTPYAPNLLDIVTQNLDGSVTLYYTLSTWSPYQVFLMSSTFRAARPRCCIE
jgi:hypothetical protein